MPNPTTDRAISSFQLDQLRGSIDRQRAEDSMRPPTLSQQPNLLNKQIELDRLNLQR